MIVGIGIDLCDLSRFAAVEQRRPGVAARCLTAAERATSASSRAARFAAKEALAKALGAPAGLRWCDVEVVSGADGAPSLRLSGTVQARAEALGISRTHLSLSHDAGHAVALVVCES